MNLPFGMPMRPLGMSRDSHNWITIGEETLLFTGDIFLELDILGFEVLVMDCEV
jgi:hypothetical protein